MRKRYFARSAGRSSDQPLVARSRAAPTAASTSSAPGLGDLGQRLLGGREIVVNHSPERGSTISPPTKRP